MNSKWADYVITAVRHDTIYGHITYLRVCEDLGDKVGVAQIKDRDWVIDQINHGRTFITVFEINGELRKGAQVEIVKVNGQTYIRTDSNYTAMDNLGNLPKF